jgi:hypothetical protein
MPTVTALPSSTAVPQPATFAYPVLSVLGSPSVTQAEACQLSPAYDFDGQIVGATLVLPDGMPASAQLDQIESAIAELRRHIAPNATFTRDRVPTPEAPRRPVLTLVPTDRRGSNR